MKRILLSSCLVALLSGCSTIVSDSHYPVSIRSTPSEANFSITNSRGEVIHKGVTPSTVTLSSSDGFFDGAEYTVTYQKDDYTKVSYTLTSSLDGWYLGNVLFGGLVGLLIIDPATGAMWKLPESASMELTKKLTKSDGLTVMSVSELPEKYENQLEKI
ncbi:MAG: hypothetical protein ACPGEF_07550 [Endozoicomonas sp.]